MNLPQTLKPKDSKQVSGGGFPAGTRVHTDRGLVRIEELVAGDMVLTHSTEGEIEAYQKVLRTITLESETVRRITFNMENSEEYWSIYANGKIRLLAIEEQGYVNLDGDWVRQQDSCKWTAIEDLKEDGTRLSKLADGSIPEAYQDARHHHLVCIKNSNAARIVANVPVYRTNKPNCGWSRGIGQSRVESDNNVEGGVRDFINSKIIENNVYLTNEVYESNDPYLKTRLYSIELEGSPPYYIGNGIYVRNET